MATMPRQPAMVDELLHRFGAGLRERLGPRVQRVVLFGSRARGTAMPGSDVDVLVVVDERDPGILDMIYELAAGLSLESGLQLSAKVYTAGRFEQAVREGNPFIRRVLQEGVER